MNKKVHRDFELSVLFKQDAWQRCGGEEYQIIYANFCWNFFQHFIGIRVFINGY